MAKTTHTGKAGQLAVMAEFLRHGYNVAVPEIDRGTDVLAVRDESGYVWRVQVKTATAKPTGYGASAQFSVPMRQLTTPVEPALLYALALRRGPGWWEFLIIPQDDLLEEVDTHAVGAISGGELHLYLAFREHSVICSGRDWQPYRDNFALPASA